MMSVLGRRVLAAAILFGLLPGGAGAREPQSEWWAGFNSAGDDSINSVAVSEGSVYVAGTASGSIEGQPFAGYSDAIVQAYTDSGDLLWTREFGGSGYDYGTAVAVAGRQVYVAAVRSLPGQNGSSLSAVELRRYSRKGVLVWSKVISGQYLRPEPVAVYGMALSPDGKQIVLVGWSPGALADEPEIPHPSSSLFVASLNADGMWQWIRRIEDPESVADVSFAGDAVHVVGTHYSQEPFRNVYSRSGELLASHKLDSPRPVKVLGAGDGGAWIVGSVEGVGFMNTEVMIRRIDAAGNTLWTNTFGTDSYDQVIGLHHDRFGGVRVTALGAGVLNPDNPGARGGDLLARFRSDGSVIRVDQLAGGMSSIASAVEDSYLYFGGGSGRPSGALLHKFLDPSCSDLGQDETHEDGPVSGALYGLEPPDDSAAMPLHQASCALAGSPAQL